MGTLPAPCRLLVSSALAVIYFLISDMRVWAQNHVTGPPPCSPHRHVCVGAWPLSIWGWRMGSPLVPELNGVLSSVRQEERCLRFPISRLLSSPRRLAVARDLCPAGRPGTRPSWMQWDFLLLPVPASRDR